MTDNKEESNGFYKRKNMIGNIMMKNPDVGDVIRRYQRISPWDS